MGDVYFYISCTVALVCLVLYLATCTAILKNLKTFSSSYYKLYIFSSVVNVVTFWNSVLALRIPPFTCYTCAWAPILTFLSGTFLARLFTFGIGYYGFLQYTMSSIMAFNRFTAVFFPFKHNNFWRKYLAPLIVITLVYPLIFEFDYLIYPSVFLKNNLTASYGLKASVVVTNFPGPIRTTTIFTVCFGALIINVILNSCVLIKVISQRKRLLKLRGGKDELRLVLHNLVSFIGEAFASLVTFMLLFPQNVAMSSLALYLIPPACDSVSLFSPVILLVCNTELRTKIFGKIRMQRQQNTRVISIVSIASNR